MGLMRRPYNDRGIAVRQVGAGESVEVWRMKRVVRNLVLLVLLLVAVVAGYYVYVRYTASQAAAAAATAAKNTSYAAVTRGSLLASVSATGNIVPVNTARLTFRSAGIVQ